jgi:serine/threonine-protein kinase HipA
MDRKLDVYWGRNLVGKLTQDEEGRMRFKYLEAWLENPLVLPLSHSLPLRKETFKRRECQGFFGGILPEETNRKIVAKNLGISDENEFAMLELIGGECAGAVVFLPEGQPLAFQEEAAYRQLSPDQLAAILKQLPARPLLAGEDGVRLSLAGAQVKLAVRIDPDGISLPLGESPSTHILKPAVDHFPGVVFNEAFCMRLAKASGLPAADVETGTAGGIDYLLVERYDRRRVDMPGQPNASILERLHQEDFCQAMGIPSVKKYETEGGPSLMQCFALVREVSRTPVVDLRRLLDAVIFNCLVGNHDAHGKNFSFIHGSGAEAGQSRLAPLYDVVCTVYYPGLSTKMAMKLGGESRSERLTLAHFERLAVEAELSKPMVRQRVRELADTVLANLPGVAHGQSIARELSKLVEQRCRRVLRLEHDR